MKMMLAVVIIYLWSSICLAQTTMIVPSAVGGQTDVIARILSNVYNQQNDNKILVENKPGAEGIIGNNFVASKKGNKNFILLGQKAQLIYTLKTNKSVVEFNPKTSFKPIIEVGRVYMALATSIESDVYKIQHLNNTNLIYGYSNAAANIFLDDLFIKKLKLNTIPLSIYYKSTQPMLMDVTTNRINIVLATLSTIDPLVQSNKLKFIAITSPKRLPLFKDIPVVSETIPNFNLFLWFGLLSPADVDSNVISHYNKAFNKILKDADIVTKLESFHQTIIGGSIESFEQTIQKDIVDILDE
jgi:tripartite-type tricarboxylate transporter receptor subunit TctC